jgi:hypothetical protein
MEQNNLGPIASQATDTNFWQILQLKSARTEGLLTSFILTCAHEENLSLEARLFFSTLSPLEKFLPETPEFNRPLNTNLEYLAERARLLSLCRRMQVGLTAMSQRHSHIENIKWLLRFQLYGFADACMKSGKLLLCLLALKEAELLNKKCIRENLSQLVQKNPSHRSLIEEFIPQS